MSRTRHAIVIALMSTLLFTVAAMAQEISVEKLPASVVKTVPQCGDTNVDPDLKEISIAFSKNMVDQAWSFVKLSEESFPKLIGSPKYLNDKRTCVVQIALEPEKTYAGMVQFGTQPEFQRFGQSACCPIPSRVQDGQKKIGSSLG